MGSMGTVDIYIREEREKRDGEEDKKKKEEKEKDEEPQMIEAKIQFVI